VAEATLLAWHKREGEAVKRDENLIDIETDKVVLELPAPADGVLVKVAKGDGGTVVSGEVIGSIDTDAKGTAAAAPPPAPPPPRRRPARPRRGPAAPPPRPRNPRAPMGGEAPRRGSSSKSRASTRQRSRGAPATAGSRRATSWIRGRARSRRPRRRRRRR